MRKVQELFSFQTEIPIWKIHVYPQSNYIVLEHRDATSFEVCFTVVDAFAFKLVHVEKSVLNAWWQDVKAIHHEFLCLVQFDSEHSPVLKGVAIYNLESMTQCWEASCERLEIDGERLVLDRKPPVHIADGAPYIEAKREPLNIPFEIPLTYKEPSDYFSQVSMFLQKNGQAQAIGVMDYFENDFGFVVSYYHRAKAGMINDLLVFDLSGKLLMKKELGKDLTGYTDNTFFFFDNKLIFVEDRHHFLIYELV